MNEEGNHLLMLLTRLCRARVSFIVAGGVAAVLHGVERMTMDVDIAIEETPENIEHFLEVVGALGLVPRAPVPARILTDRPALDRLVEEKGALVLAFHHPEMPWLQLDVFLARESSFAALKDDTQEVALGETTVRLVSASALIRMKRRVHPVRPKDVEDITALEKILADETRRTEP